MTEKLHPNGKKLKQYKEKLVDLKVVTQNTQPQEVQSKGIVVEDTRSSRVHVNGRDTGISVAADIDDDWEFEDVPYRLVMNKPMPRS